MPLIDRDKYFTEAINNAFSKLSREEQEIIDNLVQELRKKCNKLGVGSALELIVKLSIYEMKKTNELSSLFTKIDNHKGDHRVYPQNRKTR